MPSSTITVITTQQPDGTAQSVVSGVFSNGRNYPVRNVLVYYQFSGGDYPSEPAMTSGYAIINNEGPVVPGDNVSWSGATSNRNAITNPVITKITYSDTIEGFGCHY